ncbi:unnamed protein product [Caenorhabditis bovis]|uniref:Uncharacterized protein n=2 Tax=Caenorhabditis bovis TaxID=2654633 RepID=A0A8S1ELY0_9PELO|nr:unnamed protein product [Caenorhabditis bovis]
MKTAVFGRDSVESSSPCGAPPSLTFTPPAALVPPSLHHTRGNTRGATGGGSSSSGGGGGGGAGTPGPSGTMGAGGPRASHSSRRTSRMHNVSALGHPTRHLISHLHYNKKAALRSIGVNRAGARQPRRTTAPRTVMSIKLAMIDYSDDEDEPTPPGETTTLAPKNNGLDPLMLTIPLSPSPFSEITASSRKPLVTRDSTISETALGLKELAKKAKPVKDIAHTSPSSSFKHAHYRPRGALLGANVNTLAPDLCRHISHRTRCFFARCATPHHHHKTTRTTTSEDVDGGELRFRLVGLDKKLTIQNLPIIPTYLAAGGAAAPPVFRPMSSRRAPLLRLAPVIETSEGDDEVFEEEQHQPHCHSQDEERQRFLPPKSRSEPAAARYRSEDEDPDDERCRRRGGAWRSSSSSQLAALHRLNNQQEQPTQHQHQPLPPSSSSPLIAAAVGGGMPGGPCSAQIHRSATSTRRNAAIASSSSSASAGRRASAFVRRMSMAIPTLSADPVPFSASHDKKEEEEGEEVKAASNLANRFVVDRAYPSH